MAFKREPLKLGPEHLRDARLFADRSELTDFLPEGSVGFELGVAGGDFSQVLLDKVKPQKLFLNDLYAGEDLPMVTKRFHQAGGHLQYVQSRFRSHIDCGQVELLIGSSENELAKLEDHSLDWIYIDGNHSYEFVKKDLALAKQKVKLEGTILINDYVLNCPFTKTELGVVQATNEFCFFESWRIAAYALNYAMYSDVALIHHDNTNNPFAFHLESENEPTKGPHGPLDRIKRLFSL